MATELVQLITLGVIYMTIGIVRATHSTVKLLHDPAQRGEGSYLRIARGSFEVVAGGFFIIACNRWPGQVSQFISKYYLSIPILSGFACGMVWGAAETALERLWARLGLKRVVSHQSDPPGQEN